MRAFLLFVSFFLTLNGNVWAGYSTFEEAEAKAAERYNKNPDNYLAIWHVSHSKGRVAIPSLPESKDSWALDMHPHVSPECHDNDYRIRCYTQAGYYVQEFSTVGASSRIVHLTFQDFDQDIRNNLVAVYNLGNLQTKSLNKAFANCPNLRYVRYGDTSQVTDMARMFQNASALEWVGNPPVNGVSVLRWDTSQVADMSFMFNNAQKNTLHKIVLNLTGLNVSQVKNMEGMFFQSGFRNVLVRDWNVSSVKNMSWMFRDTSMRPNVGRWNVSSLKNISYMFEGNRSNRFFFPDVRQWKAYNLEEMEGTFSGIHFPSGLATLFFNGQVTSQVKNMRYAFLGSVNPPLALNLSGAVVLQNMYRNATLSLAPNRLSLGGAERKHLDWMEHYWTFFGLEDERSSNYTLENIVDIFTNVKFSGAIDYTEAWKNRQKLTKTLLVVLWKNFLAERSFVEEQDARKIKARGIAYCGEQDWSHIQSGKFGRGYYLRPKISGREYQKYVTDCKYYRDALVGYHTGFNFCNTGEPGQLEADHPKACEYHVDQDLLKNYPRQKGNVVLIPNL